VNGLEAKLRRQIGGAFRRPTGWMKNRAIQTPVKGDLLGSDYLTNGGRIEVAQRMARHSNAKTTGLYDRPTMPLVWAKSSGSGFDNFPLTASNSLTATTPNGFLFTDATERSLWFFQQGLLARRVLPGNQRSTSFLLLLESCEG
jgi:hypothetical protein